VEGWPFLLSKIRAVATREKKLCGLVLRELFNVNPLSVAGLFAVFSLFLLPVIAPYFSVASHCPLYFLLLVFGPFVACHFHLSLSRIVWPVSGPLIFLFRLSLAPYFFFFTCLCP
jgi:uncharacterized membrane protein